MGHQKGFSYEPCNSRYQTRLTSGLACTNPVRKPRYRTFPIPGLEILHDFVDSPQRIIPVKLSAPQFLIRTRLLRNELNGPIWLRRTLAPWIVLRGVGIAPSSLILIGRWLWIVSGVERLCGWLRSVELDVRLAGVVHSCWSCLRGYVSGHTVRSRTLFGPRMAQGR